MSLTRRELLAMSALGATLPALGALAASEPPPKAATPLRILILGGTGFIGPHQQRYALARGHKVTLFNRGESPQRIERDVEELVGDRNTGDLKSLAGRYWDVCIDNPTTLPFWVRDAGKALQGRVGHYVFISTVSVYADDSQPGADEAAAVAAYRGKDAMAETQETLKADRANLYGPLKALCEKEAEKWFPKATTVIRPGLIAGPGDETDRFTYWPVRIARGGRVLAPGDGTDAVQFIDVRDVAEWTIRMAEARAAGIYNATGPDYELSMAAMLQGVRAVTTAGAHFVWAPTKFLREHNVSAWSDMPVWLPGEGETGGFARRSIAKARAAGLTFRPLAATASDTLAWFQAQPAERQATLKAGLSAQREAELLQALQPA